MAEQFTRSLEGVPWFASIGKPIPQAQGIRQIGDWADWPGPEDESVSTIHFRQQALHDRLAARAKSNDRQRGFELLWSHIQDRVCRLAASAVPYDPSKDCYFAPNAAVWQAAWTASLIGACLFLEEPIPADLQSLWDWFRLGRWPCALEELHSGERLVVL